MHRLLRRWLLVFAVTAAGLLLSSCSKPRPTLLAARASGPDFQRNEGDISHPTRIIVYGDMRFTDPHETTATNPKVRRWLVDQIAAERPDAILLSGDVPWHGGQAGDYDVYRAETQIWRDAHLHVYPALGNHEFAGSETQCLENWWNAFPELRGRRWYSVALGNSIYILNLDSNLSLSPDSGQITWIKSQLASLPATVRFVFLNLHHPPVVDVQKTGDSSHNGRPNERALAEFLAREPEKSHLRFLVVAGHIHNYERFSQDGSVYVVSGGGGAIPHHVERGPEDLYQDSGFPNYHYMRFVEEGEKLVGTMVRVANPEAAAPAWQEKDHFEVPAGVQTQAVPAVPHPQR